MKQQRPYQLTRVILAAVCISLVGLLFLQVMPWEPDAPVTSAGAIMPDDSDSDTIEEQPEEQEQSVLSISAYDEIIQRPLFNQDRKPFVPTVEPETVAAQPAPPPPPPRRITLLAVLINAEKRMAIMRVEDSNKLFRVAVGGSIDSWRLKEVMPHSATLVKGAETRQLKLQISKSGTAQTPPVDAQSLQQQHLFPPVDQPFTDHPAHPVDQPVNNHPVPPVDQPFNDHPSAVSTTDRQ